MKIARFAGWKSIGGPQSDYDAEVSNCTQALKTKLQENPHLREKAATLVRRGFHDPLLILYILGLRKRPDEGQKNGR